MEEVKKNNVLSFDAIKEANKQFSDMKVITVYLDNGEQMTPFEVGIYKVFSPTQIASFVKEYLLQIDNLRRQFKSMKIIEGVMMPYMMFCAIKNFTNVQLPHELEDQLVALEHLQNQDILFEIYNQFDEDELDKVLAELNEVMETFKKNEDAIPELVDEYSEKIVDKSLLKLADE